MTEAIKISIDEKNFNNWKNRYVDPRLVIQESKEILTESEKNFYEKGKYYSKLNIIACKFLLSEHTEHIINELYEIISFFERIQIEIGYIYSLNTLANVLQSYGDYKKALELILKSQRILKKVNDKESFADNHSIAGLIHLDLFDYENAIKNFKCALGIREKLDNQKAMASSLNLIARANSLKGNFSESLDYYNKALELRLAIDDIGGLPWTHIGLASTYEKMSDYHSAIKHYQKALDLNKIHNDKRCKLHCFFGLGAVNSIISPSKIAEDYLLQAKKIADELNAKPILYQIFKNLSELYERMLDVSKAFTYFKLYQKSKEEVVNAKLQNQLKNKEIVFAVEQSQKEAEIYRLKNVELKEAYEKVEKQHQEIKDSINYAKNIQIALLPSGDNIEQLLPERFIIYRPRDIVSGDFYWLNKIDNRIIIAAADCTGHGVPGAFVSMLGISFLNEIVNKNNVYKPDLVLNELRDMVISALNQNKKEVMDGMDISLALIDLDSLELQYAGAFNPLLIYRNNGKDEYEMIQIDGDRMPIGLYLKDNEPFLNREFQLRKGDTIYMFSDGYPDQFGGNRDKKQKFMRKRFKQLLSKVQPENMEKQKQILEEKLDKWQGNVHQTDDITVIGIRF